jgi:hypothetical protein
MAVSIKRVTPLPQPSAVSQSEFVRPSRFDGFLADHHHLGAARPVGVALGTNNPGTRTEVPSEIDGENLI